MVALIYLTPQPTSLWNAPLLPVMTGNGSIDSIHQCMLREATEGGESECFDRKTGL